MDGRQMWMDGGWRFLLARHSTSPGIVVSTSGSRDTSTVVQARRPNHHLQEVSRAARGLQPKHRLAPLSARAGVSKICMCQPRCRAAPRCRRQLDQVSAAKDGRRHALHHACIDPCISGITPEREGFCYLRFRGSSLVALGTAHRHSPLWRMARILSA